jgi:hypothetical protein
MRSGYGGGAAEGPRPAGRSLGPDRCRLTTGSWSWRALAADFARFDAGARPTRGHAAPTSATPVRLSPCPTTRCSSTRRPRRCRSPARGDQSPQLDDVDLSELQPGTPPLGPYRTFQVPVADVALLTGLDLDPLTAADVAPAPAGVDVVPSWRPLAVPGDIRL